jgi:hypothetical protein
MHSTRTICVIPAHAEDSPPMSGAGEVPCARSLIGGMFEGRIVDDRGTPR